jgi:3',5'-cyclic AMP phosphodiesterase CpdA
MPQRIRPVFKTAAIDDQEKFQPLPAPIGAYPYHLDIQTIIPDLPTGKMVFHMAGDTGGLVFPEVKHRVATAMVQQFKETTGPEEKPRFLFHLGDVVYSYGQAEEYYPQFFEPYRDYPAPVFAIPGNHDADLDPFDTEKRASLDAFVKVFCDFAPHTISFAEDARRLSNVQPNIYFTLKTPLADIIALYSNVPRFGNITSEQQEWFIRGLEASKGNGKALIVCLHHSAYSADINHGSSLHMQRILNQAFQQTGVYPAAVFFGAVDK